MRDLKWFLCAVASVAFAAALGVLFFFGRRGGSSQGQGEALYIWAGDQAHKASDFLAVMNPTRTRRTTAR